MKPPCPNCGAEGFDNHGRRCPDRKRVPQSNSTLARSAPLRAKSPWRPERKPLRPRSKKMAETYKTRRILVRNILDERRLCEARWDDGCLIISHDVHEILPRSQGGRIIGGESSEYLAVCRYCHDEIETHPEEAHARGFRQWSWERKINE